MSLMLKIRDGNIKRFKIDENFLKEIKIRVINEGMRDRYADFTICIDFPKDIKYIRIMDYIQIN